MASMNKCLMIKPMSDYVKGKYSNHSTFNVGDSGLDLFCPKTITIGAGETVMIDLEIQCELHGYVPIDNSNRIHIINLSYYLYPRSSMGLRTPLRLANSVGIIDAGYRGNICAVVDNIKSEPYTVNEGDRLFQICTADLLPFEFKTVNELSNSNRGSNGFGSSGR